DEESIKISWKIRGSLTANSGTKKVQIVIKKEDIVYLSKVFQVTVLESLQVDDEIVETNISYLEYWEQRINELAEKVENGEFNFDDLTDEQKEKLKGEQGEAGKDGKSAYEIWIENGNIGNEQDFLNSLKGEKGEQGNTGEIPTELLNTLQTKEDNNLNTNDKSIVGAINEIKRNISDLPKQDITAGNGIEIKNNVVNVKVDDKTIGFNDDGKLEARLFTGGNDEGNTNIKQYLIKDVKSGQIYTINDEGLPVNHKVIPCVLALENSKTNSMEITDFKLNIEDIVSNDGIYIQNSYDYEVKNNESPVINKADFNKILGIKGGV
ncbi:MAG: hypothetical protein K2F59_00485, partial [Eubacteriales bacterium]|nr:hypothetical protein [Eubacteriales bacterium]